MKVILEDTVNTINLAEVTKCKHIVVYVRFGALYVLTSLYADACAPSEYGFVPVLDSSSRSIKCSAYGCIDAAIRAAIAHGRTVHAFKTWPEVYTWAAKVIV